jgi:hypothetical protein
VSVHAPAWARWSVDSTRAAAPASAAIAATSAGRSIVDTGTGTTPERIAPNNQAIISGESLVTSTTRSSRSTPERLRAHVCTRHVIACICPYVTSPPR